MADFSRSESCIHFSVVLKAVYFFLSPFCFSGRLHLSEGYVVFSSVQAADFSPSEGCVQFSLLFKWPTSVVLKAI